MSEERPPKARRRRGPAGLDLEVLFPDEVSVDPDDRPVDGATSDDEAAADATG